MGIVHLHEVGVRGSGIKVFRLKRGIPLSVLGVDKLSSLSEAYAPILPSAAESFDPPIPRVGAAVEVANPNRPGSRRGFS